MDDAARRRIDGVWRLESAKIVADVARLVRDIGLAEELAQDALVAALEHWPRDGIPDKPAAWLMTTAKHRALDRLRHARLAEAKHTELGLDLEAQEALTVPDFVDGLDAAREHARIGDDLLRLVFTACHPVLSTEARVALTLKLLAPREPEVHGLVALMELTAARAAARTDAAGRPVLLLDQDRGRWDRLLIRRGLAALARADALCAEAGRTPGPYALQAAIVACHVRAGVATDTDWARIVALYDALADAAPSPVVELNRAVTVGMAEGPAAALALVDGLAARPALRHHHWLPSARGDLLARLGRPAEAAVEFERAAALAHNERERALLLERAAVQRATAA